MAQGIRYKASTTDKSVKDKDLDDSASLCEMIFHIAHCVKNPLYISSGTGP